MCVNYVCVVRRCKNSWAGEQLCEVRLKLGNLGGLFIMSYFTMELIGNPPRVPGFCCSKLIVAA